MRPRKKQARYLILTVLGDVLAIMLSFFGAFLVRFFSGLIPAPHQPTFFEYGRTLAVVLPVYLGLFRAYGLYSSPRHIRRIEEIFIVLKAVSFAVMILMAVTFLYRTFSYSRIYLGVMWIFSVVFVSLSRYLLIQWEYRRRVQKRDITKTLLVGANRNARSIIQWSRANPHYGHEIIGILGRTRNLVGKHVEGVPILGTLENYEPLVDELGPQCILLLDTNLARAQITDLVAACEDRMVEFKLAADFYGLMSRNVTVEYLSSVPLLGFRSLPLDDFWNRLIKRVFDVVVAFLLLVLSFPLWILAIILIKLDDGGPILYRQSRMGRDQVLFDLLKFRTMRVDAEKETGPVWAAPHDHRRTRVGPFLRRWNLDELPQLLNVLKGHMSLVGPRPERPHFVNQFKESIPRYMRRHKVKAGITGWAQVNGYRGDSSIQQRINYDLYYMENWSLLLDIEILLMTVLAYKNAY